MTEKDWYSIKLYQSSGYREVSLAVGQREMCPFMQFGLVTSSYMNTKSLTFILWLPLITITYHPGLVIFCIGPLEVVIGWLSKFKRAYIRKKYNISSMLDLINLHIRGVV